MVNSSKYPGHEADGEREAEGAGRQREQGGRWRAGEREGEGAGREMRAGGRGRQQNMKSWEERR